MKAAVPLLNMLLRRVFSPRPVGAAPLYKSYPGVAQLAARMVRDHEAVGSNPATRTKHDRTDHGAVFFIRNQKKKGIRYESNRRTGLSRVKNLAGKP